MRSRLNQNKCVHVAGAPKQGANVVLSDCLDDPKFKWKTHGQRQTGTAAGNIRLTSVANNMCLDISGGNPNPGANVQIWPCNNTAAQDWKEQCVIL